MSASIVHSRSAQPSLSNEVLDMVCVGFGPAGLTIAVALEDQLDTNAAYSQLRNHTTKKPHTLFFEKQSSFNWHAGMLLHSAKMQISFIKDLATVRDPSSRFTFLNYLKVHGRLRDFSQFNTFLPSRFEFSDYLRWAAGHFDDCVRYGHEVVQVRPVKRGSKVAHFEVEARDCSSGQITKVLSKQIIIAAGGSPSVPSPFRIQNRSILHSSQYETSIDRVLPDRNRIYRIAIVGSGQSAAEIFDDLATRFPNAYTSLIFRDSALRPSDDSPFVNEVFNPTAIDTFFQKASHQKLRDIKRDRATNYSVVRLELIEKIYADLYLQDIHQPDILLQRRRMLACTEVLGVESTENKDAGVRLALRDNSTDGTSEIRNLPFDAVIFGTGYTRNAYLEILRECRSLGDYTPKVGQRSDEVTQAGWVVQRDYSLKLRSDLVDDGVGLWLQGCNEATHGLSDSLLSVLATRSGELIESMFGDSRKPVGSTAAELPLKARL